MNDEITLRDLFAMCVAIGCAGTDWNPLNPVSRKNLALAAYATADELLKARVSVQTDTRKGSVE